MVVQKVSYLVEGVLQSEIIIFSKSNLKKKSWEKLGEKNRISKINQTNHRNSQKYQIFSLGQTLYIKSTWLKILHNGLSDYASNYEEEECLRNRFFW